MLCGKRDAVRADITPYTTPLGGTHSATLRPRQPEPSLRPANAMNARRLSLPRRLSAPLAAGALHRLGSSGPRGERRAGRPGFLPGPRRARGPAVPGRALEPGPDCGRAGLGGHGERRHRLCGVLRRDARAAATLHHAASQAPYRLAPERARALKTPASAMPGASAMNAHRPDQSQKVLRMSDRPQPGDALPYHVELWHAADRAGVEQVLGRASGIALARAIFTAASSERPDRRITVRRSRHILADSAT